MDDRHPEDCIACRAEALGMTPEQIELITEAMAAAIGAGWKQRGIIGRAPTRREANRMLWLAHHHWVELFGTQVPESAEVRAHRQGH